MMPVALELQMLCFSDVLPLDILRIIKLSTMAKTDRPRIRYPGDETSKWLKHLGY